MDEVNGMEQSMAERFLQNADETFAGAVTQIETFMKHRKNSIYDKNKVIISSAQVKNVLKKDRRFGRAYESELITAIITGAYGFKKTKQIFKIDETLCEELFNTADELNDECEIPCDVLLNMPYQGFYIELPECENNRFGVMVSMDYGYFHSDSDTACYAINFILEHYTENENDNPTPYHLRLPLVTGTKLHDVLMEHLMLLA